MVLTCADAVKTTKVSPANLLNISLKVFSTRLRTLSTRHRWGMHL